MLRRIIPIVLVIVILAGIAAAKTLLFDKWENTVTVVWQGFIDEDGSCCARCTETLAGLRKACVSVKQEVEPAGVNIVLTERRMSQDAFEKNPAESNRIWVNKKPIEEWISASVGKSPCPTCSLKFGKDIECRTLMIKGENYEIIPEDLLMQIVDEIARQCPKYNTLHPEGHSD